MFRVRGWVKNASIALAVVLAGVGSASCYVEGRHAEHIVSAQAAQPAPVAVVFGAGLAPGQDPSPVLAARLDTAIALLRQGKVKHLLLSGDNTERYHDETGAMRRYALAQGVADSTLILDDSGVSTYASCARAYKIFGVRKAILVTQNYHLPRALYFARAYGIQAQGVAAEGASPFHPREWLSRAWAWFMVLARSD